jgi:hypothetical protein
MAKRVEVQVGRDGRLQAEFSGFAGDECIDQAERLRQVLAGFGLLTEPLTVERKDQAQIALEMEQDEETREAVRKEVRGLP